MSANRLPPGAATHRPNRLVFAILAGVLVTLTACVDQTAGPETSHTASFALATVFPAESSSQAILVDAWRVQVARPVGGVIAEESGSVGPEQETISVQITVTLETACEILSVRVELSSGGQIWFQSLESHEVCSGAGNELQAQELQFVRPLPTVNPGGLAFTVEEGESANQDLTVAYAGTDNLIWTAWVQEGDAEWLTLQPSSGSVTSGQPGQVSVFADATELTPGQYSALIMVAGEGFPEPLGQIPVLLTVTAGPQIDLYPRTPLSFSVLSGLSPNPQSITVTNSGGGTLTWSATDDAGWLSLTPASGSLAGGQSQNVSVAVASASLEPGDYLATITVRDPNAGNSPQTVSVTLTVRQRAMIGLDRSSITFSELSGVNPDPQAITITNSGAGTLTWSATDNAGWLSLTPASGSLGGGQSQNVSVAVASASLEPGTYQATITVQDPNAGNSPQTVSVTLTVRQRGEMLLSDYSISSSTQERTNAFPWSMSMTNTGGSTLNWTTTSSEAWVSGPSSGVTPYMPGVGGLTTTFWISFNTASLAPGNYKATITFSDPEASNSPQFLAVSLTVLPGIPPTISNITWSLEVLNDQTCANSGSRYDISFDYLDPDGDVPVLDGTLIGNPVELDWAFLPDGFSGVNYFNAPTEGGGFSGRVYLDACAAFQVPQNTSLRETFRLRDNRNLWSNALTIVIPRPEGGNSPSQTSSTRKGATSSAGVIVGGGPSR